MARDSGVDLLYLLFSARSRVVTGEMSKTNAASYLSGLIIGKDVEAAVGASTSLFSAERVHLICAPMLARLYANALDIQGLSTHVIDGDDAALAGLTALHAELFS